MGEMISDDDGGTKSFGEIRFNYKSCSQQMCLLNHDRLSSTSSTVEISNAVDK